jgi:hypothetical protein
MMGGYSDRKTLVRNLYDLPSPASGLGGDNHGVTALHLDRLYRD